MALRQVLVWPDKRLEEKAKPVTRIDDRLRAFVDDLVETMYAGDGVGLAATQVGVPVRIITVDVSGVEPETGLLKVINPRIVEAEGNAAHEEGCLSLPDIREEINRPEAIRVKFTDPEGNEHDLRCNGFLARAFQHEIDHLDGKLIFDRLSPLKRGLIKRRLRKARLAAEKARANARKKPKGESAHQPH